MKQLKESKTYVEFLLDKGNTFTLNTLFDNQKNSDLLKEFSFSMIEEELMMGANLKKISGGR